MWYRWLLSCMTRQKHRHGSPRCRASWQQASPLYSQLCATTCSALTHLTGVVSALLSSAVEPSQAARRCCSCAQPQIMFCYFSPTHPKTKKKNLPFVCSGTNQDMLTAVLSSEVPATPLGSFPAIFNQALALGTVSRRRVYHEAQQQQRQKRKGRRWQAGFMKKKMALDVPCRSAANTAEVSDFHWHLASNDRVR